MINVVFALCLLFTFTCQPAQDNAALAGLLAQAISEKAKNGAGSWNIYLNTQTNIYSDGSAAQTAAESSKTMASQFSKLFSLGTHGASDVKNSLIAWARNNKLLLVAGTASIVCGTIVYWTHHIESYLRDENVWANWQSYMPLTVLLQKPSTQLAQELTREIERRYAHTCNGASGALGITTFLEAVAQEKETLLYLENIYGYLTYIPYHGKCGLREELRTKIQDRLARLAHYNNVFNTWMAEHHAKRSTSRSA